MKFLIVFLSCMGAASVLRPILVRVYQSRIDIPGIDISQNVAFILSLIVVGLIVHSKFKEG